MKHERNRIRRAAVAVAALLALTLVPATLLAQPPGRGGGPRGFGPGMYGDFLERVLPRLAERLQLTEEQQSAITAIVEESRDELTTRHKAVGELHRQLAEQARAEVLDEAAIRQTAEELGKAQGELALTQTLRNREIRQVLTPEQLAQFDEMQAHRRQHFRGGHRPPR